MMECIEKPNVSDFWTRLMNCSCALASVSLDTELKAWKRRRGVERKREGEGREGGWKERVTEHKTKFCSRVKPYTTSKTNYLPLKFGSIGLLTHSKTTVVMYKYGNTPTHQ